LSGYDPNRDEARAYTSLLLQSERRADRDAEGAGEDGMIGRCGNKESPGVTRGFQLRRGGA
jgi:hypothetical protein